MRDHTPILIDKFNGLWKRGDDEAVPLDHFSDCENVQYFNDGVKQRDGVTPFYVDENDCLNLSNVRRIYSFVFGGNTNSLLVLDAVGNIYHTASATPCVPILSIPEMTDFSFVGINGRAYIAPHDSVLGLEAEFIYVYDPVLGGPARKAAGNPPNTGTMTAAESATPGNCEAGVHIIGVVYETNTGFLTGIGLDTLLAEVTCTGGFSIDVASIPVSPDSFVIKRHLVATKAIDPTLYTGNKEGYQFFFVPDGEIPDNTTTTKTISFFDIELLDDASHLLDILAEIPASVAINTYGERMVIGGIWAENNTEWSLVRVSYPGEPEAFDAVSGLFYVPADDYPISFLQEYRDILYVFKQIRTYGVPDNGDVPSSWAVTIIDQGIGAAVHGVAQVLDSGGVNIDYLIIVDHSGVMIFDGTFRRPELSFKISDYWLAIDHDFFYTIQIVNDSMAQKIYATLPNQRLLYGDYSNGLAADTIKWAIWKFDFETTTITLIDKNTLILGALQPITP